MLSNISRIAKIGAITICSAIGMAAGAAPIQVTPSYLVSYPPGTDETNGPITNIYLFEDDPAPGFKISAFDETSIGSNDNKELFSAYTYLSNSLPRALILGTQLTSTARDDGCLEAEADRCFEHLVVMMNPDRAAQIQFELPLPNLGILTEGQLIGAVFGLRSNVDSDEYAEAFRVVTTYLADNSDLFFQLPVFTEGEEPAGTPFTGLRFTIGTPVTTGSAFLNPTNTNVPSPAVVGLLGFALLGASALRRSTARA